MSKLRVPKFKWCYFLRKLRKTFSTNTSASLLFSSIGVVIIFDGTVVSCEADTEGNYPDRVVFYLEDGMELEVNL